MKTPLDILDGLTADTCEAKYQLFYPACQAAEFAADETAVRVEGIFHASADAVVKSYCFLVLGAIVDSGQLSDEATQRTTRFLETELNSLTEFALKDEKGRYIHYLSHMAYLAGSLQKYNDITPIYEALFCAYLRADEQICGNEDVVIAEVLLGAADVANMLARLMRQVGEPSPPVIPEANKKALWLAMFALNGRLKKHDPALFVPLVDDLVAMVQD